MIKKELLSMPELLATDEQLKSAEDDIPHNPYHNSEPRYRYWGYMRCCVSGDLLKVAFYFTKHMRAGGNKPYYMVYFNNKTKEYLTYDCENKQWRTASLARLRWPGYSYGTYEEDVRTSLSYTQEDGKTICDYFGIDSDPVKSLRKFQEKILADKLAAKHKKETDPWDEDLKRTPKKPKAFEHWVEKDGIPEHFIFYRYQKKRIMSGFCSYCEKTVSVEHPTHNAKGVCPNCGHEITFKASGKIRTLTTNRYYTYLLQKCEGGMIIREFIAHKYASADCPKFLETTMCEVRRVFCDEEGKLINAYYYGDYKHVKYRWIANGVINSYENYYYYRCPGAIYPHTLPALNKTVLKKTGLSEYYAIRQTLDPEGYLYMVRYKPYIEKIVKGGLTKLAIEEVDGNNWDKDNLPFNVNKSTLKGILRINEQELKRMRACNGGIDFLRWLQYEKITGKMLPDEAIKWLCNEKVKPDALKFICNKMSIPQIIHYVTRQMADNKMNCKTVLQTWADYLSMATRLGMDTNDEIVYKVSKLQKRHDELVKRMNSQNLSQRAGVILMDFPHVEKILSSIKPMYEYADENYTIIVPERIEDVFNEGNQLDHCVGNSERYWDRIERRESYIMFLRKTADPDKPYYTLEVEPGGTVRQKRTNFNRQKADIKKATDFLRTWQGVISKRITETERDLAQKSKVLRIAEFDQLKKDQTVIRTGELAGQKLVDVLMKDLLVAA